MNQLRMRTIATAPILVLSVVVLAAVQDSKPAVNYERHEAERMLDQRERLRGIDCVVPVCTESWDMVEREARDAAVTAAELTMRRNGIKVRDFSELIRVSNGRINPKECVLRINLEKWENVVRVSLNLDDTVMLERDPSIRFSVVIWNKTKLSGKDPARLRECVVELTETFCNEMLKAADDKRSGK